MYDVNMRGRLMEFLIYKLNGQSLRLLCIDMSFSIPSQSVPYYKYVRFESFSMLVRLAFWKLYKNIYVLLFLDSRS